MAQILNSKPRGFLFSLLLYHLFALLLVGIGVGLFGGFLFGYYARDLPATPHFAHLKKSASITTKIVAQDGMVLASIAGESREWAPLSTIPDLLKLAFVAVEDARFFEHGALDFVGLFRAMFTNLRAGGIKQGGSTITQQVAKYFMGGERTLDRKIKELILALRLEHNLTKEEILELYVNLIFLGKRSFGVKAAARAYFNKNLKELHLSEMAFLAGMAQAPSRYSPYRNLSVALDRRRHVLNRMAQRGYITKAEAEKAQSEPLELKTQEDFYNSRTPYFTEHARRELIKRVGREGYKKGGFYVETTVNPYVQVMARDSVRHLTYWQDKRQGYRGPEAHLEGKKVEAFAQKAALHYKKAALSPDRLFLALVTKTHEKRVEIEVAGRKGTLPLRHMRWASRFRRHNGTTDRRISRVGSVLKPGDVIWVRPKGDKTYALEQIPRVQSALYTLDHNTGYVVAMVGGSNFDLTKFNRTKQACRQPGSVYKPFYYSLALNRGWSIYKKFSDVPYAIVDPATGKRWRVVNYQYASNLSEAAKERIRNHKVTLESALVWSRNIPSVTIFQAMGGTRVAAWARRFGFTTPIIPDKGLALGASCTKMDELTGAMSVFAKNGVLPKQITIKRIRNAKGEIIEDHTVPQDPQLTLSERMGRMVYQLGQRQKQVIPAKTAFATSKLLRKVITHGHNDPIRISGVVAAGKTGTASKTMDTWFVGYTSNWAVTFWLGDEKYERPLGDHDAAHLTTAPSFARFMYQASRFYPQRSIPWKHPISGLYLSQDSTYAYKKGRLPKLHPPKKKIPLAPQ